MWQLIKKPSPLHQTHTKFIITLLFYWHRADSRTTPDLDGKCAISAHGFQHSWICQPITASELPNASQSIANYGLPLKRTEERFDQSSARLSDTACPFTLTAEPWPLRSTWSNKCFPQQEACKSIWPVSAKCKQQTHSTCYQFYPPAKSCRHMLSCKQAKLQTQRLKVKILRSGL